MNQNLIYKTSNNIYACSNKHKSMIIYHKNNKYTQDFRTGEF